MENKEFDKKIATHLSQRKLEVNANVWEQIESQLPQASKSSFGLVKWAAAIILLVGLTFLNQWNKTITPIVNTEPKPILQTDPTDDLQMVTAPVDKIEEIGNTKPIHKLVEKKSPQLAERMPTSSKDKMKIVHPDSQNGISTVETSIPKNDVISISSEKPPEVPVMSLTENVMRRLKTSKTTIQIDSRELLSQSEMELYEKSHKNTREKIIEKLKTSYQELNLAIKN